MVHLLFISSALSFPTVSFSPRRSISVSSAPHFASLTAGGGKLEWEHRGSQLKLCSQVTQYSSCLKKVLWHSDYRRVKHFVNDFNSQRSLL